MCVASILREKTDEFLMRDADLTRSKIENGSENIFYHETLVPHLHNDEANALYDRNLYPDDPNRANLDAAWNGCFFDGKWLRKTATDAKRDIAVALANWLKSGQGHGGTSCTVFESIAASSSRSSVRSMRAHVQDLMGAQAHKTLAAAPPRRRLYLATHLHRTALTWRSCSPPPSVWSWMVVTVDHEHTNARWMRWRRSVP